MCVGGGGGGGGGGGRGRHDDLSEDNTLDSRVEGRINVIGPLSQFLTLSKAYAYMSPCTNTHNYAYVLTCKHALHSCTLSIYIGGGRVEFIFLLAEF